ncbi:unnamed protein product [Spirodela intermedia]|uniref:Uncharacterized protein n=1 Tax=Spirodela intermedia TaxID=51605 RepID=A0A7I8LCS9_SPIIN|nr:unnamed protein product [Spirodela intermedia]
MNKVKIILSLAAIFSWNIQQYNVKNAFLHGDFTDEVYMYYPPGYGGNLFSNLFSTVMRKINYCLSNADHTLFFKHTSSGGVTILLVYVDDIIITKNLTSHMQLVLHYLKGTLGKGIIFKCGDKVIVEMYTDANYAGSPLDHRSTSGLMIFMRRNLVT